MTRAHRPPHDVSKTTNKHKRTPPSSPYDDQAPQSAVTQAADGDASAPPPTAERDGADAAGLTAPASGVSAVPSATSGATPSAPLADDAWALVGVITGAFGLHGDLKLRPETDFPERFTRTKTLYVGDDRTPYPVASARPHKVGQLVVHLTGVESEPEAERLRNRQVFIPLVELTPLAPEQYYIHDLVGLRVEHVNGTPLGVIADVITTAASDLYVVRRTPAPATGANAHGGAPSQARGKPSAKAGDDEVLLPAVKEFVKSVSLARGVVIVDPIPGLFDDASVNAAEDVDDSSAGS